MRGCVHNFEKKTSGNEIKSQGYVSLQPYLRQFLYDLLELKLVNLILIVSSNINHLPSYIIISLE